MRTHPQWEKTALLSEFSSASGTPRSGATRGDRVIVSGSGEGEGGGYEPSPSASACGGRPFCRPASREMFKSVTQRSQESLHHFSEKPFAPCAQIGVHLCFFWALEEHSSMLLRRAATAVATRRIPPVAPRRGLSLASVSLSPSSGGPGSVFDDSGAQFDGSGGNSGAESQGKELDQGAWARAVLAGRRSGVLTTINNRAVQKIEAEREQLESEEYHAKLAAALYGSLVPFASAAPTARELEQAEAAKTPVPPRVWVSVPLGSNHDRHLRATARCSLVVQPALPLEYEVPRVRHGGNVHDVDAEAIEDEAAENPRDTTGEHVQFPPPPLPRVNLRGSATPLAAWAVAQPDPVHAEADVADLFVANHPSAKGPVERDEVSMWLFEPTDVFGQLIGGAVAERIDFAEFCSAEEDPVAAEVQEIASGLRQKFGTSVDLLARVYGATEVIEGSTFLYFVDRHGCNIQALDSHGAWRDFRLPFPFEMTSLPQCCAALEEALTSLLASEKELDSWRHQ
jgi:hypothetical protein